MAGAKELQLTNIVSDTLQGGAEGVRWTFDFSKHQQLSSVVIDWR